MNWLKKLFSKSTRDGVDQAGGESGFLRAARKAIRQGNSDAALYLCKGVLAKNPRSEEAWSLAGQIHADARRDDQALDCYDRALKVNPGNAPVWDLKGLTHSYKKEFTEAIRCYDEAIALRPDLESAWMHKGLLLDDTHRKRDALECYNKVLQINARNAKIWFWKSVLLVNDASNRAEGMKCLRKAASLGSAEARDMLKRIPKRLGGTG